MANSNGWGDGAANNAIGWGQGANNAIGWGDIHADSWAGLTDIVGITTPPFTFLLDDYSGATVGYSLRKLRSAYSGNCIRVRRSSDNTEQNIGFVNNILDTASLLTFVGAGNGFVTTWYDQSGNGNNAIQTTAGSQPQIVSSGNLVKTSGNITAIDCNNKQMSNAQINTATQAFFLGHEVSTTGHNSSFTLAFTVIATDKFSSVCENGSASLPYNNFETPTYFLNNASITATRNSLYDNNATGNETLFNVIGGGYADTNRFLQYPTAGFNGNYKAFEVIIYNTDQSSNRTGINGNINTYYSIY
jgi:hypothetical protein